MNDPKGIIVNHHLAYTKEVLVELTGVNSKKDAGKFVGKKALYKDKKGNVYVGHVSGLHGRNGTLKVKFKYPLPSNSLAKPISIAG